MPYPLAMPTETREKTAISERAAQEEIRDVVRSLEALRFRLVGVRESLPADEEETGPADLRTVIDCVLTDSLGPAIRELRKAADDRLAQP